MRIAAILTCHNRVAATTACVESLLTQDTDGNTLEIFLVDDGSTDGTAAVVRKQFPNVHVITGDGSLFWNGGMRLAWHRAMAGDHDHYLWVNDDIVLDDGALRTMLETHAWLESKNVDPAIVVGCMRDPVSGELTYGGVCRPYRWRPLKFERVPPGEQPRPAETMNGNFVLVSRAIVERVGNLDPAYRHSMGDFDYGLRARRNGCSVWMAPGTVGECPRNPPRVYGRTSMAEDLRSIKSLKGVPPAPWHIFARRWAGPLWPFYYASPYIRKALRVMLAWCPGRAANQPA